MMDSSPLDVQLPTQTQFPNALTNFMQGLQSRERVFTMHQLNKHNQPKNRRYFSHLESRAIKEAMDDYQKNPDDVTLRNFSLGFYSIDFELKRIYETDEPDNTEGQFLLEEVASQKRDFRCDNSRNAANIAEPLKEGNKGVYNKLGTDWYCDKNNYKSPTVNQIITGLKAHERVMLAKTSCLDPSSQIFQLSYEGLCRGWDSYFSELTDTDFDTPLDDDILYNPNHEVPQLLLYLYTSNFPFHLTL